MAKAREYYYQLDNGVSKCKVSSQSGEFKAVVKSYASFYPNDISISNDGCLQIAAKGYLGNGQGYTLPLQESFSTVELLGNGEIEVSVEVCSCVMQ